MPEYSSSTVLKDRLTVAVQEGQGSFDEFQFLLLR